MSTDLSNCMYGLAAEFEDGHDLLAAAKAARAAGYEKITAYSPFEVDGIDEVLEHKGPQIFGWLVLGGLILGVVIGLGLQYYASVEGYAINVGGRPLASWPAFLPVAFELGILGATLGGVTGFFLQAGLPLPYHPIFNTPNIDLASRSRFFLCIETRDRQFHLQRTRAFLEGLEPVNVSEVTC